MESDKGMIWHYVIKINANDRKKVTHNGWVCMYAHTLEQSDT